MMEGTKKALQNMMFYYYLDLIREQIADPKQYIASELGGLINLTEGQIDYVLASLKDNTIEQQYTTVLDLLNTLSVPDQEKDTLKIATELLTTMKANALQAIETYKQSRQ